MASSEAAAAGGGGGGRRRREDDVSAPIDADAYEDEPFCSLREGEKPPPLEPRHGYASSHLGFFPGDGKPKNVAEPHHHHHHHHHHHPSHSLSASKLREPLNREMYRIPSYAGWFSWGKIHAIERQSLPEFFDGRSISKTPKVYKEYREFIINKYREIHPRRSLTFTEVRKMLVGDVNLLRKVFDFLEYWGLINFHVNKPSEAITSAEKDVIDHNADGSDVTPQDTIADSVTKGRCETEMPTTVDPEQVSDRSRLETSVLESLDKAEEKLLDKGEGDSQSCGKQPNEPVSPVPDDWTMQEVLRLLEGLAKYGENWNQVAHYVATKSRAECITRFVRLPFGDQFFTNVGMETSDLVASRESMAKACQKESNDMGPDLTSDVGHKSLEEIEGAWESPLKRSRLTPLADSSNPILAQAAFLSAMAGPRVATAAAQAAVAALSEEDPISTQLLSSLNRCNHTNNTDSLTLSNPPQLTRDGVKVENGRDEDGLLNKKGDQENGNGILSPAVRVAEDIDIGAIVANAKSSLDQEEREIEHLMTGIIDNELKQLYNKVEYFEELEFLLEKELLQVERAQFQVLADWIRYSHYHYNSRP